MSKRINAISTRQPSIPAQPAPATDPDAMQRRWWRLARPARPAQTTPNLTLPTTTRPTNYDARLRRWRPFSAPPNDGARWRWLASAQSARSTNWAGSTKRWRPQTAR